MSHDWVERTLRPMLQAARVGDASVRAEIAAGLRSAWATEVVPLMHVVEDGASAVLSPAALTLSLALPPLPPALVEAGSRRVAADGQSLVTSLARLDTAGSAVRDRIGCFLGAPTASSATCAERALGRYMITLRRLPRNPVLP